MAHDLLLRLPELTLMVVCHVEPVRISELYAVNKSLRKFLSDNAEVVLSRWERRFNDELILLWHPLPKFSANPGETEVYDQKLEHQLFRVGQHAEDDWDPYDTEVANLQRKLAALTSMQSTSLWQSDWVTRLGGCQISYYARKILISLAELIRPWIPETALSHGDLDLALRLQFRLSLETGDPAASPINRRGMRMLDIVLHTDGCSIKAHNRLAKMLLLARRLAPGLSQTRFCIWSTKAATCRHFRMHVVNICD